MKYCTELDRHEQTPDYTHLVKKHPCFNGEAHTRYGRIHLPVSPACNIQCRFCQRGFNKSENRPGVCAGILQPAEALDVVKRALELCPQITVAGIAGPGDTLATDHAIETFRLISRQYPDLVCCLSTNGLRLAERAKELVEVGVKTITVTVNAADAQTLARICSYAIIDGRQESGELAAKKLLAAQKKGIRRTVELGLVVKLNTVLIPGINDFQIGEVAKLGAQLGVHFINVIPLIPQHEMVNYPVPTCQELNLARSIAEQYLPVFRHCRQCRADACGIPGSNQDWSEQLYGQRFQETFSHG